MFDKDIEKQLEDKADEIGVVVRSESKLQSLLNQVTVYLTSNSSRVGAGLSKSLGTLSRLVHAYLGGRYRDVPKSTLSLIAFGFLYFISPIDLIPDALIPFGFVDDAFVLGWVVKRISGELTKFRTWERVEDCRTALQDFPRDEIRQVFLVGGWFSKTADFTPHIEELKQIYPQATLEHFQWESNGSWEDARNQADQNAPQQLRSLLQSANPQSTVLLGHSLGGRIVVRFLAQSEHSMAQAILMGAAIDSDDADLSDAVLRVRHDILNFHNEADGVLRYLYQGYQKKEPLGLSGSAKDLPGLANFKVAGTEEHIYGLLENAAQLQTILRSRIPLDKLQWGAGIWETFGNWNKHHFLEYLRFLREIVE